MDKARKTRNLRVNPYGQAVEKSSSDGIKLAKDVRKCGRAQQKTINQKVKRMLNQLFKRMAPLVAGIMILGTAQIANAGYANITSFYYYTTYEVRVEISNNPGWTHTFWWFDQNRTTESAAFDGETEANTYPGVTNVAVYVYNGYPSSEYSYAIIDSVEGTTIWNGP